MRVLLTGSRDWTDRTVVYADLDLALSTAGPGGLVLVHGACPTGADAIADEWAAEHPTEVVVERHPADWEAYGKAAGPKRNAEMVALGADAGLAYWKSGSRGTGGTIGLMYSANIPCLVRQGSGARVGSRRVLPVQRRGA